jgi:hypothetical protein
LGLFSPDTRKDGLRCSEILEIPPSLETLLPFNHISITPKPLDEHFHWIALLLVLVNLILLPKPPQQRKKNFAAFLPLNAP